MSETTPDGDSNGDEPERPPTGPWFPEHLRGIPDSEITDEQRAEIRAAFRERLNSWTPERRAASKADIKTRIAANLAKVDARNAAETADPSLRWRRLGAEAARNAVLVERGVPAEGVAAFREAFDEALREARDGR
ncbi:hypothetical protein [Dactylosporangium sp. NPDC051484]|uniref:hypothetical protein n=1 Tax=Dactylosporangium sp. NPDC051484 TaxID=3154942 RepID=UPI00344D1ACC